tara:strand:+ start:466 stop:1539 length:1074 start_codon:yes stop_codon:yes gene_type:complete
MVLKKNIETKVVSKLLKWYFINGRNLPWRPKNKKDLPNPYFTLISEFMLQQTTVNSVVPKFNSFISVWPSLEKLSKSNESKILDFWSGLGYYNRAKNLFKTVKIIKKNYKSIIPNNYNDLIKLPGVGEYTAKAILSIAYNQSILPVDTNIKRFVLRLYGIDKVTSIKEINLYVEKLVSKKYSSQLSQALMDYGSAICSVIKPKCKICLFSDYCIAYKKKIINRISLKNDLNKIIKFTRAYVVLNEFQEILIRRRSDKGMLASMLEVPNDIWVKNKSDLKQDKSIKKISKKYFKLSQKIVYSFSHLSLHVEIFSAKIKKKKFIDFRWISLKKIDSIGMPTVMKKIIKVYIDTNSKLFY